MNFTHFLLNSIPHPEKLLEYGFIKQGSVYNLKSELDDEFYALVTYDSENLIAEVYENETDEKYALLDVKNANGSFVNGMRGKVQELLDDINQKCFSNFDTKTEYIRWLENELHTTGDYPWEDDTTAAVYRCENKKWFALLMKIKYKNLGFESDEPVWAVNLKADAEKIPDIVDKKSVFPAWHMNKKYWITVILTSRTNLNQLKSLTLRSKELVENKGK